MMAGVVLLWQMAMLAAQGAGMHVAARPHGEVDSDCLLQLAVEDISRNVSLSAEASGSGAPVEEIFKEELSTMENVMENVVGKVMEQTLGVMDKRMGDIVEMKKLELGAEGRKQGTEPAQPTMQPIVDELGPARPKEVERDAAGKLGRQAGNVTDAEEEEGGGAAKNSAQPVQHAARGRVLVDLNKTDPWATQTVEVLDLAATDPDLKGGYMYGFTDGTYGYPVPSRGNGAAGSWKLPRFDLATFTTVQVLNLAATDPDLNGFFGGFTDGIHGYYVPGASTNLYWNGKVARVDLAGFATVQVLNLDASDPALRGFIGGFSDGTYGYALPYHNGVVYHGKMPRFDLAGFSTIQSLDLTAHDPDLGGFHYGFTDGTYGYANPESGSGRGYNGKVPRFDLAGFSDVWVLDLKASDPALMGFHGGFTDGTYGYMIPMYNSWTFFGKVPRFDLAGFSTVEVLDLTTFDTMLVGFHSGFTDGTYGYAIPNYKLGFYANHRVPRFDLASFTTVQVLDFVDTAPDLRGYTGGFTDGTYGYAIPLRTAHPLEYHHGRVARFTVSKHKPLDFSGAFSGSDQSSVVGDPHVTSVAHAKFEIRAAGMHKLVQIPQFCDKKPDLRVDAKIEHLVGDDCSKSFMTSLTVFGRWAEDAALGLLRITQGSDMPNTTLLVNTQDPETFFKRSQVPNVNVGHASLTFKLKGVGFHVGKHFEGRYGKQRAYLNVRIAGLKQFQDLGGLLGYDSHADAEKPDANCAEARPAVAGQSSFMGARRSVPSSDGGSRIEAE